MTSKTTERQARVERSQVACWRLGSVDLATCRECPFLVRLVVAGELATGTVVCADPDGDAGLDMAW